MVSLKRSGLGSNFDFLQKMLLIFSDLFMSFWEVEGDAERLEDLKVSL